MQGEPKTPRLAVSACVWRDGKFLLVERGKPPNLGLWSLPGGHVDFGEALGRAARRELREETQVEAGLDQVVDVVEVIDRDDAGQTTRHYVIVVFGGPWLGGEPTPSDDAARAEWLTLEEIAGRPTTHGLLSVLGKAARLVAAD